MNYRHAYHAGNFADVLKHAVMVWIVRYLQQKAAPLALIDTHAGLGLYDLAGEAAAKTGEAEQGIQRIAGAAMPPDALRPYLELIHDANPDGPITRYPGSPWLMSALARENERVVACELHPEDGAALRKSLSPRRGVQIVIGDGYRALSGFVPPPEKRGLVLIDPPFEQAGEFETIAAAFIAAHRKWPTGVYMLWYPVKDSAAVARFHAELVNTQIQKMLAVVLNVARTEPGLSTMGLVVCNAPFTFESDWREALAFLTATLAHSPDASFSIESLSGE